MPRTFSAKVIERFPGDLPAQVGALAGMLRKSSNCLRVGQSLFNALYELAPAKADGIRSTELDPFYDDDRVAAFKEWLLKIEEPS